MLLKMATKTGIENEVIDKQLKNQGLHAVCEHSQMPNNAVKLKSPRKRCVSASIIISSSPKKKKKDFVNIIPPKKFLLGGNISDPLNLNSLQNEDINKAMNKTPKSSPLHSNTVNIKKDQINVKIPRNLSDPLELSTCVEAKAIACLDLDLFNQKTANKSKKLLSKQLSTESIILVENIPKTDHIPKYCNEIVVKSIIDKKQMHDIKQEEEIKPVEEDVFSSPPNKKFKSKFSEYCIADNNNIPHEIVDVIEKIKDSLENIPVCQINTRNILIPKTTAEVSVENITKKHKTLFTSPEKNIKDNKEKQKQYDKIKPTNSVVSPVVPLPTLSEKPCKPHQIVVATSVKQKPKNEPKFKEKNALFKYGNYNRYYGYRNHDDEDNRLKVLSERMDLFYDKDVLDIGCNIGHVTFSVARDFGAKSIVGMDIDRKLINIARKNVQYYINNTTQSSQIHLAQNYQFNDYVSNSHNDSNCDITHSFPISLPMLYGPINLPGMTITGRFPYNVSFVQGNYVLDSDDLLSMETCKFDVILCLSITKWLHLNWGDDGLKRAFKRMYAQLRPGGILVVEPQPWKSYGRRKTLTETIWRNYKNIQLKPPMFTDYLLNEVGFANCETLAMPHNSSKGFQRPLKLFRKSNMLMKRNIPICTIVKPNEMHQS